MRNANNQTRNRTKTTHSWACFVALFWAPFLALMETRRKWREEGERREGGIRGMNGCMRMYMISEVTFTLFYSVLSLLPDLYTFIFTSVILNVSVV